MNEFPNSRTLTSTGITLISSNLINIRLYLQIFYHECGGNLSTIYSPYKGNIWIYRFIIVSQRKDKQYNYVKLN